MDSRDSDEVDLKDYLKVLSRRRWWVISVLVVVVILTAIITYTSTPIYKSSADIMIQSKLASQGISSMLSQLNIPLGMGNQKSDIQNQVQLITTRATLARAQQILQGKLGSEQTVSLSKTATGDSPSSLISIEDIKNAIQVSPVSGSNLISISATSSSPTRAMLIANAVAEAYQQLDHERAVATLSSVQSFLSEQMDTVKKALDASQEELIAFQQKNGILLQQSLLTAELSRVQQLLVEAQVNLKDDQTKLESINKFLANVKHDFLNQATSEDKGTPVLLEIQDKVNFLLKLQKDIAQLEKERSQYLAEGNYAQAKIKEQEIINKRKTLEETAAKQYPLFNMLPQYEDLIKSQLDITMEIEALKNRVSTLESMKEEKANLLLSKGLTLSQLQGKLDITQKVYEILLDEYQKTRIAKAAELGNVEIINSAEVPKVPIKPRKKMNLLVGIVLGILGGVGAAFLREFLDNTVHSEDEVEESLGLVSLGSVPRLVHPVKKWRFQEVKQDLLPNLKSNPVGYQAFLNIATNFRFLSPDKPLKTIVITSALPNEGKSTIAANLAFALATNEKKVLLVDADFRRPVLEDVFELKKNAHGGLSDFILTDVSREDVIREIQIAEVPRIWFLSAGKIVPNPTELISSKKFNERIAKLAEDFDHVIFDSPPLAIAIDAAILAQQSDGIALVIRASRSRKEDVLKCKKDLERHDAKILGAILNGVLPAYSPYYSSYYYGYYHNKRKNTIGIITDKVIRRLSRSSKKSKTSHLEK